MKKGRIAATLLALAMAVSSTCVGTVVSVSAATPHTAMEVSPFPYREVYGDYYGAYCDRARMYDDTGTLILENPLPTLRSLFEWMFPFNINYNSKSTFDHGMGIGISSIYTQWVVDNQDGTYTYYDAFDLPHTLYFDPHTQKATDRDGENIVLTLIDKGYQITYGSDTMEFDKEHGTIFLIYQSSKMDGTSIYRDLEGNIEYISAKDGSRYEFIYSENGRVSGLTYHLKYTTDNPQNYTFDYDENGRLIDVTNHTNDVRGYTYTYENNQLVSSFNKLSGGVMQFSYTSTGDIIDTVFIPKD